MQKEITSEQLKVRAKGFQKLEEANAFGNQIPVELLLECLAHPYQYIRIEIVRLVSDYRRQDFAWIFGLALNDKCDYVVQEAAYALAKIHTDEALEILGNAFFEGAIERPHHIANAISEFGERGFAVLSEGVKNSSPNIRYYSARGLGSTGLKSAESILEELAGSDNEKTSFGGMVSTAARKGLKTLLRNRQPK